jgi:hypothetical protein
MNTLKSNEQSKDDSGLNSTFSFFSQLFLTLVPMKKGDTHAHLGVSPPQRPRANTDKRKTSLLDTSSRKPVEVIKETVRFCTDLFSVTHYLYIYITHFPGHWSSHPD